MDSLGGTYVTAADMNTGQADMDVVGERTAHVLGAARASAAGRATRRRGTASGVFHGDRGERSAHAFGIASI